MLNDVSTLLLLLQTSLPPRIIHEGSHHNHVQYAYYFLLNVKHAINFRLCFTTIDTMKNFLTAHVFKWEIIFSDDNKQHSRRKSLPLRIVPLQCASGLVAGRKAIIQEKSTIILYVRPVIFLE